MREYCRALSLCIALIFCGCKSGEPQQQAEANTKTESTPSSNNSRPTGIGGSDSLPTPAATSAPETKVDEGGWYIGYAAQAQKIVWEVAEQYFSKCDDERYFTVRVTPAIEDIYRLEAPEYFEIIGLSAYVVPWTRDDSAERNKIDWLGYGYINWSTERREEAENFNPLSYRKGRQFPRFILVRRAGSWEVLDDEKDSRLQRLTKAYRKWDCDEVRRSKVWIVPK